MNSADPIVELIAQNLLAALGAITTANGYWQDVTATRATARDVDPLAGTAILETGVAEDAEAPYGQAGRRQYFLVTRWLRKPESSEQPIDQAMFRAASDIETAVMVDPRRGGLVDVDTIVHAPQCVADAESGFPTVQALISVVYVTDRQDPTSIPTANRNAKFYQGGAIFSFARWSQGAQGAWRDFRGVKLVPTGQPATVQWYDSSSGVKRPVRQQTSAPNEKYEFTTRSLSPDDLIYLFGASAVQSFTQSAAPLVAVPHTLVAVDAVLPLCCNGNRVYDLASIDLVTNANGSITYAAGTDYLVDAQGLATGRLKIPPASTIAPGTILISMTPNAIEGRRQFIPQSSQRAQGRAEIIWLAADGDVMVRTGIEVSITPVLPELSEQAYSDLRFTVTVLADSCNASAGQPVGAFVIPRGAVPAIGY